MKNKKTLTYMIGGSFAIIAVVAAIVISYLLAPANVYARQISAAEKYLESGDYSNAILAYQDAIEQDPDSVDAYAGLANVYITRSENDSAIDLLRRGVARTNSPRLRYMLNMLLPQDTSQPTEMKTTETAYLDTATMEVMGSYSYADYLSRYGLANKQGNRDGSVTCTFNGLDAQVTFSNTASQPNVVSATVVNSNAIPTSIVFTNALQIFGVNDYITYQTLETLHLTNLHIQDHPQWTKAVVFEEKNVRVMIQSDDSGNISAGAQNEFAPLKANEEKDESAENLATATGYIKDAQTNSSVSGAHLIVREGSNQSGEAVEEVDVGAFGEYEFHVEPGEYTVEVNANGYITVFVPVYIGTYEGTHNQDIILSKTVGTGEARIVLTWSSSPRDLDSYLVGTLDDGTNVFTSFYNQRSGSNAELDIDNTSGYGPETTTIYNLNGVFRFLVLDYTGSGAMNGSGATVTVYLPDQPVQTIQINTGITGNVWSVVEIDHGQVKIANAGNVWGLAASENSTTLD